MLTRYRLGDEIKKKDGRDTYSGGGEVHTEFWWGNLKEGDHLEYVGVDGRIILNGILKVWDGMDWIHLTRDVEGWWVVDAIMNLRVPLSTGNFMTS